ncbi:MAG: metallophosphoesterase, partial [Bacteroidales bacterium]|nr:metallophosphoesterase [Bacteroidales bacterium]
SSKYKTYTILGNHELYTGHQDCVNLLKKARISLLLDDYIILNSVVIAGRLDRNVYYRKSLREIIPADAKNLIVVDHEPDSIDESAENNALLHLSGHTHAGQMFPISLVTGFMYKPTGILGKIKNTYFYITNGAGFWGPPYRIGNIPEVALVKLGNNKIISQQTQ